MCRMRALLTSAVRSLNVVRPPYFPGPSPKPKHPKQLPSGTRLEALGRVQFAQGGSRGSSGTPASWLGRDVVRGCFMCF